MSMCVCVEVYVYVCMCVYFEVYTYVCLCCSVYVYLLCLLYIMSVCMQCVQVYVRMYKYAHVLTISIDLL